MSLLSVLRSPLLHFFLLGGCIFALFAVVDDTPPAPALDEITLAPEEAERIVEQFRQTWNRSPSASELQGLMRGWALEEAYVREAKALGLEQGDPVIRQRLNLKMKFLAEGAATTLEADDATLQAYLEENADTFRRPAEVSFDQMQLRPQVAAEPQAVIAALLNGADPETYAAPSLLPMRFGMTPAPVVDRSFGEGFAAALAELPVGEWAGPVQSGYGLHIVRVTGRIPSALPELDDIRERVEAEWRAEQARESRDAFGEMLLSRYSVSLPTAEEVLSQ